jgi:hypothetical protein
MQPFPPFSSRRAESSLRLVLLMAAAIVLASSPAAARSKPASCEIVSEGRVQFRGRCLFTLERGGSFSLGPLRRRGQLYGSILSVSVAVVGRGVAEVRGLTTGGINSRWGRAVRSKRDRACWVGRGFRVCAR